MMTMMMTVVVGVVLPYFLHYSNVFLSQFSLLLSSWSFSSVSRLVVVHHYYYSCCPLSLLMLLLMSMVHCS